MQLIFSAFRIDDIATARRYFLLSLIALASMLAMLPDGPGVMKLG